MLALLLGALGCRPESPVVINEVLSANGGAWADPDGDAACPEHDDFVELFNRSRSPVDLAGFTLSDDPARPDRWALPDVTIDAGGYLLVVADGAPTQGPLHASFSVAADGETLGLYDGGRLRDEVVVPALAADEAWGRYGDGEATWRAQPAPSPGAANEAPPDDPCLAAPDGFDDHTRPCVSTLEGFLALAETRNGLSVVKSDILSFQDPTRRHVVLLDSRFYDLHDEWYWFRMLNGQPVEGESRFPPFEGEFATIDEIYAWARSVDLATLFPSFFLRFTSTDRLYSDAYYDLALGEPRIIGVSTLIHAPATATRDEVWAFELEASDNADAFEIGVFFDVLEDALPADVAPKLKWLVRSSGQEVVADEIEASGGPLSARVLRYDALTATGEVEVYRGGTVAGTVRTVRAGEPGLEDSQPTDILIVEEIPDFLPPCAALITAVPQTPLAHVALLAESRGIPNLYVAGILDDPRWQSWARSRTPVALRALGDDLDARALSSADYAAWRAASQPAPVAVADVDWATAPWTVDPTAIPLVDMPAWRPILGGKSAGYIGLAAAGVDHPDHPLAITGRAFVVQMATLPVIAQVLALPEFARPGDPRLRFLVLEGQAAFDRRYAERVDAVARDAFLARFASGTTIGDLARGGGLRGRVADAPLGPVVQAAVGGAIAARFADFAPTQGLRLRSSSTVEDLEGFVGAGLYESDTAYVDPDAAGHPDRTVARALGQVWGSYWGSEAFEERHRVGFDHTKGAMGVLVHARFDDDLEVANGVITTARRDDRWTMTVNVQPGAISVTNPPVDACPAVLPEVVQVVGDDAATATITRVRRSTESPDADVLDDAALRTLFAATTTVGAGWITAENAAVPAPWARSTITLDLEFRQMAAGWPAWASGEIGPARLVIKQARSLDPSSAALPEAVQAEPFPRDVLAAAQAVGWADCTGGPWALEVAQVRTDPLAWPAYAAAPFAARLTLTATADVLGWSAGDAVTVTWPELDAVDVTAAPWSIDAAVAPDVVPDVGLVSVAFDDGELVVETPSGAWRGSGACAEELAWVDPDTWLAALLDAP